MKRKICLRENHTLPQLNIISKNNLNLSRALIVALLFLSSLTQSKAQLIQDYDFAGVTFTGGGYQKAGIGTYYRNTTGSTISFGSVTCYGYSISAATSSNIFYFKADKAINSFTVKGTGTGSNRTFNTLSTSATLTGTYSAVTAAGNGIINSSVCGTIQVVPATVIAAGTFFSCTFSGNLNITSIEFNFVPTGTPPTITTDGVTCGRNTASVNGTVTPGTMPLNSSGIVWSTLSTPLDITLSTKTVNTPSATTAFTNTATNLLPSTQYYYRAYVKDAVGNVYYGAILTCTTNPATLPLVSTTTPFNVLSYKASSGGSITDSGGLVITQKGICWSTSPNPTTAGNKTVEGANASTFTSLMRVLSPCATYYVRAYAVNALGVGYGNEIQFQAGCPATPALIANPLSINFGSIPYNTSSTIFSYSLSGYNLTPAAGTVTITPPAGYTLATSAAGPFSSPLTINYTGGAIPTKNIYVKLATSSYGTFNGNVVHSGGGTIPVNADTVKVTGSIIPDPNVTTNLGTDFWTGFGYQEKMSKKAGDAGEAKLSVYISVPAGSQPALVNVEMPGIAGATGFPKQNISVNGGSVLEVKDFPTGDAGDEMNPNGLPDSRLYYTGVSKRGIHIYSTNGVPISVWIHSYTNGNSAAGAMLFPTNTWNNAYTVQAFGGYSNNSNPNSYFFVVANEDNTPIWFKPSEDILDSSAGSIFSDGHTAAQVKYAKGIEYGPINLNKGQVFNAMGFIQGSGSGVGTGKAFGLDLTGSSVRTICGKTIAVFGGNGRCLINASNCSATSGSDHMIQQMFPNVAWGTKYLTVPTKTMEYNVYRINVSDPATKVWVNNPAHTTQLTGLVNNLYYQIQSNAPQLIESDKPITVTQFIVAGGCGNSNGSKGQGDPEMIILSPVKQAVNKTTVYSPYTKTSGTAISGHYINVVIHKDGRSSFRLDGLNVCDTGINQTGVTANSTNAYTYFNYQNKIPILNAFIQHPGDPNYYYAKFRVDSGKAHSLSSDSIFNAIAYGMGDGESYGYNAGTNIKDLTKPLFIDNPYSISSTTNTSCTNNPIKLKAVLPYPPSQVDSITWYMGNVTGVSPQANVTLYNPTADSTFVTDGVSYYVYKNPVTYTFPTAGSYNLTGIVGGTFASQCGSTSPFNFNINIVDPGFADFNIAYNPCVDDTVRFTDASSGNGFPIIKWRWDFGDSQTDTVQNPKHFYATHAIYNIKLRAINSIGCYADSTKTLDMTSLLIAKFGKQDTICVGSTTIFSDSSSNAGLSGAIQTWYWDYGDGGKDTVHVSSNMSHIYTTPGKYYVTLKVQTAAGCTATYLDSVVIRPNPVANFIPPGGVCLPGATTFTNTSTIQGGTISDLTFVWNFGDGSPTSTVVSPSHTYPNTTPPPAGYNILLTATSTFGCIGTKPFTLTGVYTKPAADFTVNLNTCFKDSIQFNDNSSGTNQTINNWYWDFGDNTTSTLQNPKHRYAAIGTYNVRLAVMSDKGCASDTSNPKAIKVNPLPVAAFTLPSACLTSGSVIFTDGSSINPDDGTQQPFIHAWTFGDPASGPNNTSSTTNGQHTYTAPGSYQIIHQVTTANGCKTSDTLTYSVAGSRPKAAFNVVSSPLCSNKTINIQNATTIAIGTVTKIEVAWDNVNAPGTFDTYNNPTAGQTFSHNYIDFQSPSTNNYVIRVRAYSGTTCFHDTTQLITLNASPKTKFLPNPLVGICFGDTRQLTTEGGQTSSLLGTGTYNGNGINATGLFNSVAAGAGTHQLEYLWVTPAGCRDSSKTFITVWPAATASFTVDSPRCEKNTVTFRSTSTPGAGTITSYTWNFGDATAPLTSTSTVTHVYSSANTYNVTLQVQTSNGCSSSITPQSVKINYLPRPDFTPPASVCLPDGGALFADNSTIPDNTQSSFQYAWDFGDAGMSLQKDPLHRYSAVGPFNVKLTVISSLTGCSKDTIKIFNNIHAQPTASFVTTPLVSEVCLGDSIRFISTSIGAGGTVDKWRWDLGDGTTDTTANFWHTFTTAKTYDVKLHIFNSYGCVSDTAFGTAIIDGFPTLNAGPDVYMLQGSSVVLNPTVTNAGASIQYLWTGPNLSNPTLKNPIASPPNDQEYVIKVTNGLGCSTQDTLWVRLYRPPVFPNAFSPNGDGINDTWEVKYLNTYSDARIEMFDRQGRVVYSSKGYNKAWDGTTNGKPLPVGVYYYVIHLGVVPQPLTGWVTLLR